MSRCRVSCGDAFRAAMSRLVGHTALACCFMCVMLRLDDVAHVWCCACGLMLRMCGVAVRGDDYGDEDEDDDVARVLYCWRVIMMCM